MAPRAAFLVSFGFICGVGQRVEEAGEHAGGVAFALPLRPFGVVLLVTTSPPAPPS
jgi:hypothetical protein